MDVKSVSNSRDRSDGMSVVADRGAQVLIWLQSSFSHMYYFVVSRAGIVRFTFGYFKLQQLRF